MKGALTLLFGHYDIRPLVPPPLRSRVIWLTSSQSRPLRQRETSQCPVEGVEFNFRERGKARVVQMPHLNETSQRFVANCLLRLCFQCIFSA
jgi:hypothetical protein